MSDNYVSGIKLPAVPYGLIEEMERVFTPPIIEVGYDKEKALWEAAQYAVVEWLRQKAHVTNAPTAQVGPRIVMGQ